MVRKYKFVVKPEIGPEIVLILECSYVSHLEKPSDVFDGRISILEDRSVRIWDYYPEISDESTPGWNNFFQVVTLTPLGQVRPLCKYEFSVCRIESG